MRSDAERPGSPWRATPAAHRAPQTQRPLSRTDSPNTAYMVRHRSRAFGFTCQRLSKQPHALNLTPLMLPPYAEGTFHALEPSGPGKKSLPVAARAQPGGLVRLGRGSVRQGARRRQAHLSFDRLFHLPLVPRDGAGIVRKRGRRRPAQSRFRADKSGSRGAPGCRPHLHVLRSGCHRRRGLADVGLADPRVGALLRRHLLSAGRPLGPRRLLECPHADRAGLAQRSRPHRRIGAPGAGATRKAVRFRRRARRQPRTHRLRRDRERILHLPTHLRFRNGRIRPGAQVSAARRLRVSAALPRPQRDIEMSLVDSGFSIFRRTYDSEMGGFGPAPKFPRPAVFEFLLRYHARTGNREALEMTLHPLRKMAEGGMNDQLGGGFHRYSVDERWFVPHFEKMLYDQAQLATSYLEAFQITGEKSFAETARRIFDYLLRDMTAPEGGCYSAEDADSVIRPEEPSVKGEGAFYIWSADEIRLTVPAPAAEWFAYRYGVAEGGNVVNDPHSEFSGRNILYQAASVEETAEQFGRPVEEVRTGLETAEAALLKARASRVRPHQIG